MSLNKTEKIYVAGHRGLVGSAVLRRLKQDGFTNILTATSKQLDLRKQSAVNRFFTKEKPDYVFLAAAKVGGILANNSYRATFIYDNLAIQTNVIHAAYEQRVKKLMFFGSTCVYPKLANQPIHESALLTSPLEPTNEPYAIAKIAGIKMCDAYRAQYGCNFISVMPTNLYGPNDNYDLEKSHVLPALIRRFHEAKKLNLPKVTVWGTGKPKREFLHVDDLADACLFLMNRYEEPGLINIGTGVDISIKNLALLIQKIVGFEGIIQFDKTKPDGTPKKLTDTRKLQAVGWQASIPLAEGIRKVYQGLCKKDWF